jgi:CheY-like chemotaxis protein
MSEQESSPATILVVDDEPNVRQMLRMVLTSAGYHVTTAENGFDALLQLKRRVPDAIISDLNMPHMSGFEFLSVVRRRFPRISVIAISGAYPSTDAVPDGVIADAFHAKGEDPPAKLLSTVAELIRTSAMREHTHLENPGPVWIAHNNGTDPNGIVYVVVTCTECLRCFSLKVVEEAASAIQTTSCPYCPNTVQYIVEFSRSGE